MRLTILLFDGFTALDVVGGYEVLANVSGIEAAKSVIRRIEQAASRRLAARDIPF